jgi:hypothetical protein
MGRVATVVAAVLGVCGAAAGQTLPPGGGAYFGNPADQVFTDKEAFKAVAVPAAPAKEPERVWSGGLEFGLNGSSGNADVLNIRIGANGKRETLDNVATADLLYLMTNQAGRVTKDQAILNARDEHFFAGTAWGLFAAGQLEYDQFRAYDFRVGTYAGVSYLLVRSDVMTWKGRLGAGATRQIGGDVNDQWVPEAVTGGDFCYRLTDRQSFVSTLDFYPSLGDPGQYRVRARAAYEIILDEHKNLILRLGLQDRYDSNPGPARRNDLDYFTSLLVKF